MAEDNTMTEPTETDMANTAIMLNEAVTKRVADAMLCLFDGTTGSNWRLPDTTNGVLDMWATRAVVGSSIMECIETELKTLIRQEIMNAFSDGGGCTKVVNSGDTINLEFDMKVR